MTAPRRHRPPRIPRLCAGLLALVPLLGGCTFLHVHVNVRPHELAVMPGDSVTVTTTTVPVPRDFQDPPCNTPGLCLDVTGQVFDFVVQDLPAGVSHTIDTSLQSPSTPGVARIRFQASPAAAPGLYSIIVHAVLLGQSLGRATVDLRVLPSRDAPASSPPVAIAAGKDYFGDHSLAALGDGSVRAWGFNGFGQLGDRSRINRATPVAVGTLDGIVGVSGGGSYSLALTANGLVWAWGRNWHGQLGDGSLIDRTLPVAVPGIHNVQALAAGSRHSLALRTDGTVWAWGSNFDDQLGDETTSGVRALPAPVPGLDRIRAIAAGEGHSLALDGEGMVWAWGANGYGQLGDGTRDRRSTPVAVPGLPPVRAIAAGSTHSLAVAVDGAVWAWGANGYGQLGDGSSVMRSEPVQVQGLSGIRAVAAGEEHSLALAEDGTVWAWGNNFSGQLGDGTTTGRTSPVRVIGLTGVRAIAASNGHSVAMLDCGQVWAWGSNVFGQLGDGASFGRPTPAPVPGLGDDSGCEAVALRVIRAGDGDGTATGSPAGLTCVGPDCIAIVDRGTPMTIAATPRAGSSFERWDLDCQDTAEQTLVAMDVSRQCAAVFRRADAEPFLLTVLHSGGHAISSGGGIMGPDHIECGDVCHAIFPQGTVVTLTAQSADGFGFTGWSRDCTGTAPDTSITIDGPRTCRADFQPFALDVAVTGAGRVSSETPGIDCGETCTFAPGTGTMQLVAAPAVGWQFDGWSGDCAGSALRATVVMDADRSCTASFSRLPGGIFTLTVSTTGSGHVSSAPDGIACGADCEAPFVEGAIVMLTATPDPGFQFDGWSEDCTGEDPSTQVTMSADRSCHATFSPAGGPFTLTVLVSKPPGSLGAIVGVDPPDNGIDCRNAFGPVCSQAFAAGTVVIVRPSDSSLETLAFGHWLGCDTVGPLFQCAVAMTGDRTVTATFDR